MTEIEKSSWPPVTPDDDRPVIELRALACRECSGWAANPTEDLEALYAAQEIHFKETGHRKYWHYTIQRGRSEIMTLPRPRR